MSATAAIPRQRADRTQLQQVIAGLTEGVIFLDPDGSITWANDTALALHGVTSLAGLGGTVAEYRRRFELRYRDQEKLTRGEYPMDRLLAGEAFNEVIVQVRPAGNPKYWIHEVRSMVLSDPEGEPDCLVLVLNDETERFNAEERFERAFGANPAPAIIVRLADMRYVKVNHGFLELTGYHRSDLIGRSVHEFDVLHRAMKRDLAMARLHAGQTVPQMEGALIMPDGHEKTVLLGGQPIEIGEEACMLFTFADLHPRKLAEDALRHSEERFAKAFHMAPSPMAMLTLDGLRILDVNDAFTSATGWRREEVMGRGQAELEIWGRGSLLEEVERRIRQTGHVRSMDVQLRARTGGTREFLLSAETVQIHDKPCVLSVMQDITERKQTETELLAAVEEAMRDTDWIGQKIVEKLATITRTGRGAPGPEVASLPARAQEVLALIAQGRSDEEIADTLGISRNTVRNHVSAIYARLGMHRRSSVVIWARERGLGTPAKSRTKRKKKTAQKKP